MRGPQICDQWGTPMYSRTAVVSATPPLQWLRLGLLILAVIVLARDKPVFFTANAFQNMAFIAAYAVLFAIGATLLLVIRHLDPSVGAVAALSGAIVARLVTTYGWPILAAAAVGIGVGAVFGLINGIAASYLGWAPAVAVAVGMFVT